MGANLFDADISGQLLDAFEGAGAAFPMTLIKRTKGTRTVGDPGGGTNPTPTSYTCKGFESEHASALIGDGDGTSISGSQGQRTRVANRTVAIFGDSIASGTVAPAANDELQLQDGTKLAIYKVTRDPDRALYLCKCRG